MLFFHFGTIDFCSNGIKDGDEDGVDCGGSCSLCNGTNSSKNLFFISFVKYLIEYNSRFL